MRKALVLAFAVLASLALATVGRAITFGEDDNGRHQFVGALVGDFQGDTFVGCSGTLVSSTVVVTAAHCLVGLDESGITNLRMTFAEDIDLDLDGIVDPGVTTHGGTGHVPDEFGSPGSDPHDVGVFVLDSGVSLPSYGQLPTEGLLDTIDRKTARFTTVGFGLVRDDKRKGPGSLAPSPGRLMVTQGLLSLTDPWATFSMNPSTDSGGACYGDSGGPHFLGAGTSETRIIVSVTVTGDTWCRATDKTYRLDTESALDFLDDFVEVP